MKKQIDKKGFRAGKQPLVDFHSHILPEMDDGSRDAEQSLLMLRAAYSDGVRRIVATPHFEALRESPNDFLARRERACRKLKERLADEREIPEIYLGAEVAYFSGMCRSELLSSLCIEGTDLILIEMPFEPWTDSVLRDVAAISGNLSLTPILAHVERYVPFQKKEVLRSLVSGEALVQCNAEQFVSVMSRRKMMGYFKRGIIDLLGSDCHNLDTRPPNLGRAVELIEKRLGDEAADELFAFSSRLLEGAKPLM